MTPDYSIGALPWVFLFIGLAAGLGLIPLVRRRSANQTADATLQRTDLEAERDAALARLASDDLNLEDRRLLELQAARALRSLEGLPQPASESPRSKPRPKTSESAGGFWARHPAVGGALLGGGLVGLVGVLVALAVGDAQPRSEGQTITGNSQQQPAAPPGPSPGAAAQPPLPPFVRSQVESMRAQLATNPEDLETRRQLALTLLSADQAFDAFQEASTVLRQSPEDAEALYVLGFVRYLMGQPMEAVQHFDRAIASTPTYSQPWLVKGLIQLQLEQRSEAIETWRAALEAVGGSEPRIEHLLREAQTDKSVAEILADPP